MKIQSAFTGLFLRSGRIWLPLVLALGLSTTLRADDGVVQKVGHGEVNWSTNTITATGSGAANFKDANVAVARLNAERAAKLDALRNILETIKGVQIDGKKSGADVLSNGQIQAKVMGLAKNFKVVDTRYYSDGSVDVVVQMPMSGSLTSTLVPKHKKRKLNSAGPENFTGLVVNAKSLSVTPSMAPRITDEKGKEVYGVSVVQQSAVEKGGIAGYAKNLDTAKGDNRVGKKPLVVKALGTGDGNSTDLFIANADADKLRDPKQNLGYLTEGKVIIVVD